MTLTMTSFAEVAILLVMAAGIGIVGTLLRQPLIVSLLLFFFIALGATLDLSLLGAHVTGAVIFSLFVLIGNLAPYHASKGAVRLMTKNDAVTYAPEQIRVNSIHPGYIWTPMAENHLRSTSPDLEPDLEADLEAAKVALGSVHPIGHMGEPDDIAWAVVWLASDEAKFVTGAEIAIDGGYTAR